MNCYFFQVNYLHVRLNCTAVPLVDLIRYPELSANVKTCDENKENVRENQFAMDIPKEECHISIATKGAQSDVESQQPNDNSDLKSRQICLRESSVLIVS